MDNLESAICDIQEQIAEVRSKRAEFDQALEGLETRWLMLKGKPSDTLRHRCPHCGAHSVCPQAYGEDCPLEATAPAGMTPMAWSETLCPGPTGPLIQQKTAFDKASLYSSSFKVWRLSRPARSLTDTPDKSERANAVSRAARRMCR